MPVLNRLKFRKGLNKSLLVRDRAKSRSLAAEHEFKRAEHHLNSLPVVKGTPEERRQAFLLKDRKSRELHKLEMNKLRESVELTSADRAVNSAKNLRKRPVVGGLRLGRTIADILLGSNRVTTVTKKMGRVFSVAKSPEKKRKVPISRYSEKMTYRKDSSENRGPMRGRKPKK